jgi:hypothetical protein
VPFLLLYIVMLELRERRRIEQLDADARLAAERRPPPAASSWPT